MGSGIWIYYFIAFLSVLNLLRILVMLISSDIYDIRQLAKLQKRKRVYRPRISVIIPAFNEEVVIERTVRSVLANDYQNKQLIVVNDGSSDRTALIVRRLQRTFPKSITLVNQVNAGKAAAINRAVQRWATGSLIMVVDADSVLAPTAITKMVAHFRDRKVIAAAANVKILPTRRALGIVQRFEYLISYRLKRALTVLSMEYIIGGVGSTFRKSVLLRVGLYDTDTMTEDIDVTVKCIRLLGNKKYRIHYAADAVAFTEHVLTMRSLIRQRYRWKYGRLQTFLKHRELFFSRDKRHSKKLGWYQLPYALFSEAILFLEPLLVGYIIWVTIHFTDITSLLCVYCIVTIFISIILFGEDTERWQDKSKLAVAVPFLYLWMYVLTIVEFAALLQSLKHARRLRQSEASVSWQHVERLG